MPPLLVISILNDQVVVTEMGRPQNNGCSSLDSIKIDNKVGQRCSLARKPLITVAKVNKMKLQPKGHSSMEAPSGGPQSLCTTFCNMGGYAPLGPPPVPHTLAKRPRKKVFLPIYIFQY